MLSFKNHKTVSILRDFSLECAQSVSHVRELTA